MKKNTLQHLLDLAIISCLSISICQASDAVKGKMPARITISHETLMDKIKGGWAGQVIGCTYGGPTEFVYRGKMIGDEKEIPWKDPDYVGKTMRRVPTLYDDIYMDLTFVGVFERLGIHAPVDSWPTPLPMPVTIYGMPTKRPATIYLEVSAHRCRDIGRTIHMPTTLIIK